MSVNDCPCGCVQTRGCKLCISMSMKLYQMYYNIYGNWIHGCIGHCQKCKVGGTCFCFTGLCDKCYKEEKERIANLKDSDFKPFGRENREAVWENSDLSIVVYHYWDKHSQYGYPIGMPRSPYYEKWELESKISDIRFTLKFTEVFDNKEKAIELARKINKGEVNFSIDCWQKCPKVDWSIKTKEVTK